VGGGDRRAAQRDGARRAAVAVAEVVAVSAPQTLLSTDHAGEKRERQTRELIRAHTSPAFARAVRLHLDAPAESSASSVHHCEQLSTTQESAGRDGDDDRISPATEAIHASIGRSRERQRTVLALIQEGELGHAKRVAKCNQQSVQLECPELAGGCGHEENYVPISCDSRLCPDCADRRMGQLIEKYEGDVERMERPTLVTFTIENTPDPETGKEAVQGAFGRLRQRGIPYEGEFRGERWTWGTDGGTPVKYQWRRWLRAGGRHDLARDLQKRYVEQPRRSVIPFKELVAGGLYGIDIKQQESERFHVHLHAIMDMAYIPQPALASVWYDLTGAYVVDVRRVGTGQYGEKTRSEAVAEVVGYVCKPPEFADESDEVAYMQALKGARLVQPFGSLHGRERRESALLRCSNCEASPRFWDYLGVVDEAYDNMGTNWDTEGENDPPG